MNKDEKINKKQPDKIVLIGGSLGATAALEKILSSIPQEFIAPIIIIFHRSTDSEDELISKLKRFSVLPVIEVEDKIPITIATVYVAPANYHLFIETEKFVLSSDPPVNFARPAIDVSFESAAEFWNNRTIGIILSGKNTDGAMGLTAIKNAGGKIIVQTPETSEAPELPRSALLAVPDAIVLSPENIAKELLKLFL